eukprot:c4854_g1_i1.p1 GENE.c4854_g1_i1~~c4854_g1_i1.p1  ORF type:complete len:134 (-),score=50.63 c4854_g1_i1:89-490(-)
MSLPQYTREEVEKHKSATDCWVIADYKVYDVSKFLRDHPGGDEILLEHGGKDVTETFIDIGHTKHARDLRETFLIGHLVLTEQDKKEKSEKERKEQEKTHKNDSSSQSHSLLLVPAVLIAVAAALFYYQRATR